jgi:small-conductance mechanosensitive channel
MAGPALALAASVTAYVFRDAYVPDWLAQSDRQLVANGLMAFAWYSAAFLLARVMMAAIQQKNNGQRRVPKLLGELIVAACFLAATIATVAMWLGQTAGGALASSGLIIAVLGFAVRNILADVFGGIALGLEAPFRIGDWVEIDGEVRGRVIEIGWRTTRIQTRNDIYMILPNSEIARKRVTNYSAPRKHYRSKLEIVLGHDIPVAIAKRLLQAAANSNTIMLREKKPDVRAISYDMEGVRYVVRYWVPSFVDETDCTDVMIAAIDKAIRESGLPSPYNGAKVARAEPSGKRESKSIRVDLQGPVTRVGSV